MMNLITLSVYGIWYKKTYFGAISEPCCNTAPVVNHSEFPIVNWFSKWSGSSMHGYGLSHSCGDSLPKIKKHNEMPRYAKPKTIQTPCENGSMKENSLGICIVGFLYKMPIPT